MRRQPLGPGVPEVPFADHPGRAASALEQLGERDFALRQVQRIRLWRVRGRIERQAAAERIAARHQRRASRRAEGHRRIEVRELRSFRRHAVEVRSLEFRMAVAREVTIAEVIGEDEDDVRLRRGGGLAAKQCQERHEGEGSFHRHGFPVWEQRKDHRCGIHRLLTCMISSARRAAL
jgi:hypothetical protein